MRLQTFRSVVPRCLAALLCAALLGGCVTHAARVNPDVRVGVELPPPDSTSDTGAYKGESDYRVGAQDLLQINVFGVDALNQSVRVNSNGQVSLPLIGAVVVGGKTVPEIEDLITAKLKASYLQDPQVTVFIQSFASQQVTMEGAIRKPGIYPLTGKTTLLQLVATAGGVDDKIADLQGVVVFRQIDGKRMGAVFDLAKVRAGTMQDPQIYGDDIIVVEQSGSRSAVRRFLENLPVLGFFMAVF